jgi:fructose-bisphosphate aldolase class II
MAHLGASQILKDAQRQGYGIPCLLAGNLEMMIGAVQAAEEVGAPLILAYNAQVTPQIPMALIAPAMVRAAERASVPIATILDHGASLEAALQAIQLGISTVMYDGSRLSFAENVRTTQEVVRVAHAAGVDVEGELGAIGGSSIELGYADATSDFTDPALAAEFVKQTGVDILAISFGNAHGVYAGAPQLDLARVRTIAACVDAPLAMHGGSGLAEASYAVVIAAGISKVNYYSAMGIAVTRTLAAYLAAAPENELIFHNVIGVSIEQFRTETRRLLTVLGCADRYPAQEETPCALQS